VTDPAERWLFHILPSPLYSSSYPKNELIPVSKRIKIFKIVVLKNLFAFDIMQSSRTSLTSAGLKGTPSKQQAKTLATGLGSNHGTHHSLQSP
jgi:hypothetical protein